MDYSNYENEKQYKQRIKYFQQSIKNCKHEKLVISGIFANILICVYCYKIYKLPDLNLN